MCSAIRLINEFRFGVNIISDRLNNQPPVTNAQVGINLPTAIGVNGQSGDPNIIGFSSILSLLGHTPPNCNLRSQIITPGSTR